MIPGLDAGVDQGALTLADMARLRAEGRGWAYFRMMQGVGPSTDPTWHPNVAAARAATLPFGAYFVFLPGQDPAAQVAAWFAQSGGVGRGAGELPPAIDFEIASKVLTEAEEIAALVVVILAMTAAWGRAPTLYTYPDFWRRVFANATPEERAVIATCTLWFASYEVSPPAPPAPWSRVTFWQRSGGTNGFKVPGGEPCDDDVFLGTDAELAALASFEAPLGPNPLAGIPVPGLVIPGANEDEPT